VRNGPPPARLAGEEVHGHVVLLADTVDDGDELLLPFIVEGFEQGDRAFHIVDPALRDEHLERLSEAGIDVPATTASGQLVVWTWNEGYLRGGSFDPGAQPAFLRQVLSEGRSLGYPRTRYIGSTEWAVEDPEVMRKLLAYEAEVDALVRNRPDVLICTYDLSRHRARAIADVLGVHSAAVVGGVVRTTGQTERASPRERLLTAASKLFHEMGIQAAGVDAIVAEARVAKATFYRHFPAKDDLVVAWLRDPRTRWFDRIKAQAEARGADSADLLPGLFDDVAAWLEAEGYRGCAYLNVGAEITDPAHPALAVVTEYLQEIEDYLAELLAAAGYRDSRRLATQLQALIAGTISLAVARRSGAHARASLDAAMAVLERAERI
jgi:AcrR family transcriptional regulator